ncbi:hypothetical protein ACFQQB_36390 [Nonomuraea rubra]|uniref:hypothetical protein n=1 Tax=Nonomuraea rubra TaxID=46180 RepID=UPI00360E6E32
MHPFDEGHLRGPYELVRLLRGECGGQVQRAGDRLLAASAGTPAGTSKPAR